MRFFTHRYVLIAGDIITLAIVTIIGFASHGTADTAGARMLTTFIPPGSSLDTNRTFLACIQHRKCSRWKTTMAAYMGYGCRCTDGCLAARDDAQLTNPTGFRADLGRGQCGSYLFLARDILACC